MKLSLKLLSIVCFFISYSLKAQSHWKKLPTMPIKICGSGTNFIIDHFFYSVDCKDSLFNLWKYDLNLHTYEQVYRYQNSNNISTGSNFIILNKSVFANLTIGFKNAGLYKYYPETNIYEYKNTSLNGSDYLQFVINELGYFLSIGYGNKKYNPESNTWSAIAPFPGFKRQYGVAFAIGNKGYYGMGVALTSGLYDMWQYNPDSNTWKQMANYNGYIGGSIEPRVFVIGNSAYLMGIEQQERYKEANLTHNFFAKYNAATNTWQLISDTLPAPIGNFEQAGFAFSINGKGYVHTGTPTDNFWEYDPKDIRLQAVRSASTACVVDTILVHYNIVPYKNYNITAQLSSLNDNFSQPITLAIFTDSTGADSIKLALPQGLASNQNYMLRLISNFGDTSSTEKLVLNLYPRKLSISKVNNTQLRCNGNGAYSYIWLLNGQSVGVTNANKPYLTITQNGYYQVLFDSLACKTVSDSFNVNFVGLAEASPQLLSNIFPNPNNGEFTLTFTKNNELKTIEILDALGKLQATFVTNKQIYQAQLNHLAKGIYFVKINTNNAQQIVKLLIE